MSDNLEFVFLVPSQRYAHFSGAVTVHNVREMVARVLFELAKSGGKIGKITFESGASWSPNNLGNFYIGIDEIGPLTIQQHARDLIKLAPHFAPDAQVTIFALCGSAFNGMAMYMLSNVWPGVSVTGKEGGCIGQSRGYRSSHGGHGVYRGYVRYGGQQGDDYRYKRGHGHRHGRH